MSQKPHFLWTEIYRPKTISECILPKALKETFQGIVNNGEIPNLLLTGTAGTGKTTVAKALCNELDCDMLLINGSLGADESGIDAFRTRVSSFASTVSFSSGRKMVLIDEADFLNANSVQPALRALIEQFSRNCGFIFTCNFKNKILEPIHSRCSVIEFRVDKTDKQKIAGEFLKRVFTILGTEKVEYEKQVVAEVVMKYFPDFRRTLNELQRFSQATGKIDIGILSRSSESNLNMSLLIEALKNSDYAKTREWVVSVLDNDAARIFRRIYDSLHEYMKPSAIPEIVVLIAKYQYNSAFCIDQEVNLLAFLIELMVLDAII